MIDKLVKNIELLGVSYVRIHKKSIRDAEDMFERATILQVCLKGQTNWCQTSY